jgi:hypothetical protein
MSCNPPQFTNNKPAWRDARLGGISIRVTTLLIIISLIIYAKTFVLSERFANDIVSFADNTLGSLTRSSEQEDKKFYI